MSTKLVKLVNPTGKSTVSCGWSHTRVSCECPTHDSWGGLTPGPVHYCTLLYTTVHYCTLLCTTVHYWSIAIPLLLPFQDLSGVTSCSVTSKAFALMRARLVFMDESDEVFY